MAAASTDVSGRSPLGGNPLAIDRRECKTQSNCSSNPAPTERLDTSTSVYCAGNPGRRARKLGLPISAAPTSAPCIGLSSSVDGPVRHFEGGQGGRTPPNYRPAHRPCLMRGVVSGPQRLSKAASRPLPQRLDHRRHPHAFQDLLSPPDRLRGCGCSSKCQVWRACCSRNTFGTMRPKAISAFEERFSPSQAPVLAQILTPANAQGSINDALRKAEQRPSSAAHRASERKRSRPGPTRSPGQRWGRGSRPFQKPSDSVN